MEKTMRRTLGLLGLLAFVMAVPASHLALGKAHVPAHKNQVCHKGTTITIAQQAVSAHLGHGDCVLPIDDFDHVFFTGDPCSSADCI